MSTKYPEAPGYSSNEFADMSEAYELQIHKKDQRIAELEAEVEKQTMESAFQIAECKILRRKLAELKAENERLKRPACGTEQVWLDTIRHNDEQALLWFRSMQRESEDKKKALAEVERLREMNEHLADSDSVACLQDAERYRKWKEAGVSYSNGFYQLQIYLYDPDGIVDYGGADQIADAAMEGD